MAIYDGADHFRDRIDEIEDSDERLALEELSTWATKLWKKDLCRLETRDRPSRQNKEILHPGMMRKTRSERTSIATAFIYYPSYSSLLAIHWTAVRDYAPGALSAIASAVGETENTVQDKTKQNFPVEVISNDLLDALTEAYRLAAE